MRKVISRARRPRRSAIATLLALPLALVAGVAQAQSPPSSPAPVCNVEQTFIGNAPPNSVQLVFNCNQSIQSFKVDTSEALGSTPSGAQVENNGTSEPPPQGFTCSPNSGSPKSFSCTGSANTDRTVRITMNTQSNPCASPQLTQELTVGTGQADSSGNPGGTTAKQSAGPLKGCAAAAPQSSSTPTATPVQPKPKHKHKHRKHHHKHKKHHH